MAFETVDFELRPEDGWVQIANDPTYLFIKPNIFHPWRLAITASGAPASEAVRASQTLTFSGNALDTETVTIGSVTYTYAAAPASPNDVQVGGTAEDSIDNLVDAINNGATGGSPHPDVTAVKDSATELTVTAKEPGSSANSIATTETLTNAAWGGATLAGGVDEILGVLMGRNSEKRTEPFLLESVITGEVYIRIDTPPASFPSSKMGFGVIRDQ